MKQIQINPNGEMLWAVVKEKKGIFLASYAMELFNANFSSLVWSNPTVLKDIPYSLPVPVQLNQNRSLSFTFAIQGADSSINTDYVISVEIYQTNSVPTQNSTPIGFLDLTGKLTGQVQYPQDYIQFV